MVVLNDAETTITVDASWANLTGNPTAGHIHQPAPPGVNAPVVFPFDLGPNPGPTGSMPEQTFAITPAQVAELKAGLAYMNIHTPQNPGGEIRGQLEPIPEPSAFLLVGIGIVGLFVYRRYC
jgi:hypothetical protein